MGNWKLALVLGVLIFVISRGGLPAILTAGKFLLPVFLFYFAVKHITLAIFPESKKKKNLESEKDRDSNVIRICGDCGKEENSCLKCKVGFKKKKH